MNGNIRIAFVILFGTLAVITPAEFPWYGRLIFALGALFGAGWAILGIRVVWRGSLDLKVDTRLAYGMAWGLPVVVMTLALMEAPEGVGGLRMLLFSLAFLFFASLFLSPYYI